APSALPGASSGSLLVTEESVKPAGPERASVTFTVTVIGTSLWSAGYSVFGLAEQVTVGAVLSIRTTSVFSASTLPALSGDRYAIVVAPSAVTGIVADAPATVFDTPATVYAICLTPEPPWSVA